MAEAVFTHTITSQSLHSSFKKIDSAGTSGYHIGDSPDPRTIDVCRRHGVNVVHQGQQLQPRHFLEFDWILCMDEDNLKNVSRMKPKHAKTKGIFL